MFVDHLQLVDFRSYTDVEVSLGPGVTTFLGGNGQGKTSLVEALGYLSTLTSHRVAGEGPLVRAGAERAVVRARVQAGLDDPRTLQLEIEISPGRANRAKLNRSPLRRTREILGALRTVLFSPEDLAMVQGDPAERRRFLDDLLVSRTPRLAGVRTDYERVLRQRNTLLKSLAGRRGPAAADLAATLDVWDASLARAGGELLAARLATVAALLPHVADAYAAIAPTNADASAAYRSGVELSGATDREELADLLGKAMQDRRADEIARGLSLVGPHRDDVVLRVGDLPAKGYASHGESWSLALALRLGSFALLRTDGLEPVLLLDDVFAELDSTRRERLASTAVRAEQVIVTAAVPEDVPAVLQGVRYRVSAGEVLPQ